MAKGFDLSTAVKAIEKQGALLVFPLANKKEPASIWSEFFPRKKMRWEWDESGDNKVGELWQLRERLSRSGAVIYSKWYQGRATFFAKDIFTAMLHIMQSLELPSLEKQMVLTTSRDSNLIKVSAQTILETLEMDSPLSTKALKMVAELKGKANERIFIRSTQELWLRFLIVGYGEFDDGAFPSLGIGATQILFEKEFNAAMKMSDEDAFKILDARLPKDNLFRQYFEKNRKKVFLFHPARARTDFASSKRPIEDF